MIDADKREFASILKATLDLYGREASPDVLRLWWSALEEFSVAEVRHGFSRFIKSTESGTFPPKPADIIRMIEGSSGDRGMLAWAKVREAFGRVGAYRSVAFDDAIIHAVIADMGGWPHLCGGTKDEQHFRAAEFSKRYRAYAENGGPTSFDPYLIGRHEEDNRMGGFKAEPPMLIGNPEKAAEVMKLGTSRPGLQITKAGNVAAMLVPALKHMQD